MVRLLEGERSKRREFDANYIEDLVAILFSRLNQDGFLKPEITAEIALDTGGTLDFSWTPAMERPLPRPLATKSLRLRINRGTRYFYQDVQFTGLATIPEKTARSYFIQSGGILRLKIYRIYSPLRLKRGLSSVSEILERQGFRDAQVTTNNMEQNDRTGAVNIQIRVVQGTRYVVRTVHEEIRRPEARTLHWEAHPNRPWSGVWEQDFTQSVRTNFYHLGYPDVKITLAPTNQVRMTNAVSVDMDAAVDTGRQVWIANYWFHGEERTRESVMRNRVRLHPGELLDPTEVDRARYRLSRLGVFDRVDVRYDIVDEHHRDVIFDVKEGKRVEASLNFGFGTYELLRGGIEIDHHNIWGLAHDERLRLAQSFKTSSADYTYSLPELLGEDINVFIDASGLRRKEISFLREEYGGGVGAEKFLRNIATDLSVRYDLRLLTATETAIDPSEGLRRARVGAFIFDLRHDKRDNPLYPHHGYKVFADLELASDYLGGEVNYERFNLSGSYHFGAGPGRWLHLGAEHGAVFTDRTPQKDLPFNRRFFPGGENSIRGYNQGEGAPRNQIGVLVGAESYWLGSVELEQELTPKLSLVSFVDTVGLAQHISRYPGDEILVSVGGGLSWRTLIGPIRVEYGYNLNRRPLDPAGTIQFSVGFPF